MILLLRRSAAFLIFCLLLWLGLGRVEAIDEVIPPAPKAYFNDYANVVPPATAQALNDKLKAFDAESSNQILVVVYPTMQSPSSIEDYTVRVAQAWGVGQKKRDNGVVLFVFVKNRSLYIQVGYGLEGAIPDARAFQIIQDDILPSFKQGDYAQGLSNGVEALIQSAKGEYTGSGESSSTDPGILPLLIFIAVMFLIHYFSSKMSGGSGGRGGRMGGPVIFTGGGGGSSSWGGGGFSGGGGSFGGGGAGGRW